MGRACLSRGRSLIRFVFDNSGSPESVTQMCPIVEMNLAEDLMEDMWLGVSVFSQGRPGGRVLVSLSSDWLIEFLTFHLTN